MQLGQFYTIIDSLLYFAAMDLSVALVFVIVFLVTYYLFIRQKNLPPGPLCLPFVGSIFFFQTFKNRRREEAFHEAVKEYGSVMKVQIGNKLAVVLDGYDVVHEALVKKADVFSDRPLIKSIFYKVLKDIPGEGIILHPYGDSWRMLRRFTLQALRDFGVGKTSIEEKICVEVETVSKALDDAKEKPITMLPLVQSAIANVIYGIVFGRRYNYDDPEFEMVRLLATVIVSGPGLFSLNTVLPKFIVKLINKKEADNYDERVKGLTAIKDYVFKQINDHEATFDPENIRDFIDIFLQTSKDSSSDEQNMTKGSLFRVIVDLFIAGSETTSTTLDWSFLYMSEFPEVQRKCQAEIDEVIGHRAIEYADLGKLPYVVATIHEIQRVSTIVPFAVIHRAMKSTTLRGYNIPEDTMVMASLYSASLDPKYWDEPEKFNPNRFIDKSGKFVKREANIPFSAGPRVCLGEPLARMELFVIFANLLQRFEFMRENKSVKSSLEARLDHIAKSPKPYKVRVARRF